MSPDGKCRIEPCSGDKWGKVTTWLLWQETPTGVRKIEFTDEAREEMQKLAEQWNREAEANES